MRSNTAGQLNKIGTDFWNQLLGIIDRRHIVQRDGIALGAAEIRDALHVIHIVLMLGFGEIQHHLFGNHTMHTHRLGQAFEIHLRPLDEAWEEVDEEIAIKPTLHKGFDGLHMQVAIQRIFNTQIAAGLNNIAAANHLTIRLHHPRKGFVTNHTAILGHHRLQVTHYLIIKHGVAKP